MYIYHLVCSISIQNFFLCSLFISESYPFDGEVLFWVHLTNDGCMHRALEVDEIIVAITCGEVRVTRESGGWLKCEEQLTGFYIIIREIRKDGETG